MIKQIRRRIITQTKQIAVLIDSAAESNVRCEHCGDVKLVSPLLAAKLLKIGTREVYRLIEAGEIHFVEMADRQMFVCCGSLEDK